MAILPQNLLPRNAPELFDRLLLPAVILAVGIGAFGLGRLSVGEGQGKLLIHPPGNKEALAEPTNASPADRTVAAPTAAVPSISQSAGVFMASKNGSKYYLPSCAGAKVIKPENQIWFQSAEEAQAAGYAPAANCKGL